MQGGGGEGRQSGAAEGVGVREGREGVRGAKKKKTRESWAPLRDKM